MDLSALEVFNARKPRYRHLVQRRLSPFDHLHPHRWNWQGLVAPLDHSLEHSAQEPISHETRLGLRYFWLHGLGNATSDAFFLSYIPLFALAYGASNGQVGWLTAIANLLAAVSLFPGAKAVEWVGKRKPVVTWSFGSTGRLTLLALACVPWFGFDSVAAIIAIIGLNALRAFMDNFANPAWTALVADIVPDGWSKPTARLWQNSHSKSRFTTALIAFFYHFATCLRYDDVNNARKQFRLEPEVM